MSFAIRSVEEDDRGWIAPLIRERWLDDTVVGHGTVYRPTELAGFAAFDGDRPVGLVTYVLANDACEIVTIDAVREREGIGTALMDVVADAARAAGCSRQWLITTNDNEGALAFYRACRSTTRSSWPATSKAAAPLRGAR
jgi:GNAT superfamily N-acetyltransferase